MHTRRITWKPLIALAVLLGVLLGTIFLFSEVFARKTFVGKVNTGSGCRCRFTVSPQWERENGEPAPDSWMLEYSRFTPGPPGPVKNWITQHLFRQAVSKESSEIIGFTSIDIKQEPHYARIENGYPEKRLTGYYHERVLTERHIVIDGYPGTVETTELQPNPAMGWYKARHRTLLYVYLPRYSVLYEVCGEAEQAHFDPVDHEMQAIIDSFHIEPVVGKR